MSNEFEILARFLERFGDDVQGRELTEAPTPKLRAFAQGTLTPTERADLLAGLQDNPEWLAWLAQEVKALRAQPPSETDAAPRTT